MPFCPRNFTKKSEKFTIQNLSETWKKFSEKNLEIFTKAKLKILKLKFLKSIFFKWVKKLFKVKFFWIREMKFLLIEGYYN